MDDEELRRLTLEGKAKLSLGSTQTDELDDNVLATLPKGTEFVSITPHGVSSFNETWRIETTLDGEEKLYFMKSHAGDVGRRGLLGSFESEKLFHEYDPEHVPRPIAFGNYKDNPETWFFLAQFHDMVEEAPEIETFVSIVANWHKKSMGNSPDGKWGFHVETGLPFVQHDNTYQDTWEACFTQMMRQMIIEDETVHGEDDELNVLKKDLFEKVMPRLLRPLETGGRSITPCLIHTDLWSGNMNPDVDTDKLMIYDSRGMWGHNECDLGTWPLGRVRMGTPFLKEYQRQMGMSEPQEDWADRLALYALRYEVLNAVLFPGEMRLRKFYMDEMRRLVRKFPKGLENWEENLNDGIKSMKVSTIDAPSPRQPKDVLKESSGNQA